MSYPSVHMISWQRYGYRMIGAADRFALARARTMGQTLDLSSSQYHRAGTFTSSGEGGTYTPPPPPAHVTMTAPVRTLAAANPVCPPCDACPEPPSKALLVGGGALVGGLLMYVVGLATREMKKKVRRR